MKDLVAYCSECGKKTRHRVVNCQTNACERAFLAVFTLGFSEIAGHSYNCECTKCGNITAIEK